MDDKKVHEWNADAEEFVFAPAEQQQLGSSTGFAPTTGETNFTARPMGLIEYYNGEASREDAYSSKSASFWQGFPWKTESHSTAAFQHQRWNRKERTEKKLTLDFSPTKALTFTSITSTPTRWENRDEETSQREGMS